MEARFNVWQASINRMKWTVIRSKCECFPFILTKIERTRKSANMKWRERETLRKRKKEERWINGKGDSDRARENV